MFHYLAVFLNNLDDQVLEEDGVTNRMKDSIDLYGKLIKNKLLQGITLVNFMNKVDLLESKISRSKISTYFPEFKGGEDVREAKQFFKSKYNSKNETGSLVPVRNIYWHFCTSTDTNLMSVILNNVSEIVITSILKSFATSQ